MSELPRWPERLITLARAARVGRRDTRRPREELWLLVNMVLRQRIRARSRGGARLSTAEIEDLASGKLLDLLARFDSEQWDPTRSSPGEVAGFLNTVARNAVVDAVRQRVRHPIAEEAVIDTDQAAAGSRPPTIEPPEAAFERKRFADSLVRCASALRPRDRIIWMLRVLLELPSREIARHPDVSLRPDHVDVILQRCRERLRGCMATVGFDTSQLPAGTFAALWEAFGMPPRHGEEP